MQSAPASKPKNPAERENQFGIMSAENSIWSALMMLRPTIWTLVATSALLFIVYGLQRILPKPIPGVPYNQDIGILGDLPALLKAVRSGSIRPWLWAIPKRRNSPITQVFLSPFSKPFVILSDYHESYDIMVRRTKEVDRAPLHVDEFLPFMPDHQVAMMSSYPRLKENKELVIGLMLPGILSSNASIIYENTRTLSALRVYCFAPHLQVWILKRTIWRKYFQTKDRLLSDEINKSVEKLLNAGSDSSRCKTVIDHLIKRELVMAEKSRSRPNFHKPSIRGEAFGSFIAGSDTVSTSMGWAVKFLADIQTAQAKLRMQLHSSYRGSQTSQVSGIFHTSAPYLDASMEESLRCGKTLGVGPSITELAILVADGARSPWSRAYSQRLPSWDDDEITHFNPERWLKTRGDKTRTGAGEFDNVEYDCNAGPMLSLSAGSRGCFGKRLAYLEMRIMITLLVWNFTFEECAPELSGYVECDEPTCCYVKLQRAE
ncbi:hypothetical protein E4U16_001606 [Claviceps sp. LM84 group G4]|nr:hypothetical protein E4U16_001606 [Claviceps sp. LM84 group G4]